LLIYLWVTDELSVDKFHHNDDRLFQLMGYSENATGGDVSSTMAPVLAEALSDEVPEVEYAVMEGRIPGKYTLSVNDKFFKEEGMYADKDYFHVFSYNLIQGDRSQVLANPNSIVISERLAIQFFITAENAVGKLLTIQDKGEVMVSGVFSVPANSSYQFDFILPFDLQFKHYPNLKNDWTNSWANAYVRLKNGVTIEQFNNKIEDLVRRKSGQGNISLFGTQYSKIYLYGVDKKGVQAGTRIEYVRMFSIIAIFIVVIASVNFMNLSTAKATRKLKEVGIKKAIGASRKTLIYQHLGESLGMTILSVVFAIIVVLLLLPQFNAITGKNLSLSFDSSLILALGCITLITGLVSGTYPAFYLSGFNPVDVLKGKLRTALSEILIRKGLIVFQFVLSVTLITGVLVVHQQMNLIQHKNPGYSKDNIIYFEMEGKVKQHREAFLTELKKIPGVVDASSTFLTFFGNLNSTSDLSWQGKVPGEDIDMQYRRVNYGLIELLKIQMKEGRSFTEADSASNLKIIFNETALGMMNIKDPIGKTVKLWGKDVEIIGITNDFHFQSLHENIRPLFFILTPERTNTIMVKVEAGKTRETLAHLEDYYSVFTDNMPLDFRFLDEKFQDQYAAEERVTVLSRYFAALAIVISCLGLLGLVMFTAERKTKEISIRKILGCNEWGVVYFLSADFTKMIFISVFVALPISYWTSKQWLNGFAYRIDLEWWLFAGSAAIVLLIAWLTMGVQGIKAAHINPVKSLRSE
jgi:ABC-type antimicrobial peptide transport system permease subunit